MAATVAAELRSEGVLTAQPVFNVHINYHNVARVLALSQSVLDVKMCVLTLLAATHCQEMV